MPTGLWTTRTLNFYFEPLQFFYQNTEYLLLKKINIKTAGRQIYSRKTLRCKFEKSFRSLFTCPSPYLPTQGTKQMKKILHKTNTDKKKTKKKANWNRKHYRVKQHIVGNKAKKDESQNGCFKIKQSKPNFPKNEHCFLACFVCLFFFETRFEIRLVALLPTI